MKVEIVTANEAERLGLTHSRLLYEGHDCWGKSENSYEDIVYVGKEPERISDDDLIVFIGESPNREIIQVISKWECSDKLLEIMNPEELIKRKKEKHEKYVELKKEFENG